MTVKVDNIGEYNEVNPNDILHCTLVKTKEPDPLDVAVAIQSAPASAPPSGNPPSGSFIAEFDANTETWKHDLTVPASASEQVYVVAYHKDAEGWKLSENFQVTVGSPPV